MQNLFHVWRQWISVVTVFSRSVTWHLLPALSLLRRPTVSVPGLKHGSSHSRCRPPGHGLTPSRWDPSQTLNIYWEDSHSVSGLRREFDTQQNESRCTHHVPHRQAAAWTEGSAQTRLNHGVDVSAGVRKHTHMHTQPVGLLVQLSCDSSAVSCTSDKRNRNLQFWVCTQVTVQHHQLFKRSALDENDHKHVAYCPLQLHIISGIFIVARFKGRRQLYNMCNRFLYSSPPHVMKAVISPSCLHHLCDGKSKMNAPNAGGHAWFLQRGSFPPQKHTVRWQRSNTSKLADIQLCQCSTLDCTSRSELWGFDGTYFNQFNWKHVWRTDGYVGVTASATVCLYIDCRFKNLQSKGCFTLSLSF